MEWLMNINFWGVVHSTRAFLPHLSRQQEAHIVNLSSIFGIIAPPGQTAYSAAKFAVRGFSESLRHELKLAASPVRLSAVHPGGVATNIARNSRTGSGINDNARRAQSIERFDMAWQENLVLALHRLSRAHRGENGQAENSEWESRHKDFHLALIGGCGSRWIERISAQLFDAAERYRLLALEQVLERNELQEHRDLVDACINRDADRAMTLLDHHYTQTFEAIANTSLNA